MIIIMKRSASAKEIQTVISTIEEQGLKAHISQGEERTIIGVIGDERPLADQPLEALDGVERIVPILQPFKFASRDFKPQNTVVTLDDVTIGGDEMVVMAGPCAVESREQLMETAHSVERRRREDCAAAPLSRGRPPTPFREWASRAWRCWPEAARRPDFVIVTEVMTPMRSLPCASTLTCRKSVPEIYRTTPPARGWTLGTPRPAEARHDVHHPGDTYVGRIHTLQRQLQRRAL